MDEDDIYISVPVGRHTPLKRFACLGLGSTNSNTCTGCGELLNATYSQCYSFDQYEALMYMSVAGAHNYSARMGLSD